MSERTISSGSEYMRLREDGMIYRPSLPAPYDQPSGQWRCTGAVEFNNFGYVVRRYTLAEVLSDPRTIPWKYKNGKQRVHLTDYDHGTHRTWMSPIHRVI